MEQSTPLWSPSPERMDAALIDDFMQFAEDRGGHNLKGYPELYQWSIENSELFWSALWDFSKVIGEKGLRILVNGEDIERAEWFPDAQLNFAENLLRRPATGLDTVVIEFKAEDQTRSSLTYGQLYEQVSRVANWLQAQGVVKGDRVAGYLPNMPEAIVAMLATASLGGIWTSTSPDFGEDSVIERFSQTSPKILFAADGYFYNGKRIDIRAKVARVKLALPSLKQTVVIPLLGLTSDLPGLSWAEVLLTQPSEEISFVPCGFNDPLYVLYSSGTTGKPKCITHKVGGVLLQHLKEQQLHGDIRPGDKLFYFTTCGWMMWNWLASGLASGATLVLYDGSPFYPNGNVLWDYAQEVGVTLFGTSAKYLEALNKAGIEPIKTHDLSSVRTICSTGSVLAPESFDYVYRSIKQDVCLSSISGGTDIVSCFVLGCPILPVYRGESQCRGLGMAVKVFNDEGQHW